MQITRNGSDTTLGPREWFTGAVYIDTAAAPSEGAAGQSGTRGRRSSPRPGSVSGTVEQ